MAVGPDTVALVGDVGGTNARFALASWRGGQAVLEHHQAFPAREHPTFLDGVKAYLDGCERRPTCGVIAVAGPVKDGAIDLTNSSWAVAEADLQTLGLNPVRLINDFEAQAWGATVVPEGDLADLGGPRRGDSGGTLAVLGPGTGFGVSALVRDGRGGAVAMPGEGGHAAFSPSDAVEDQIVDILRRRYGRVSIERLVSGSGLATLHEAMAEVGGSQSDIDDPAEITRAALENPGSPCGATLARFCAMLGSIAGDIALTTGARGGVYITGGIAPRILEFLQAGPFRERFEQKGRFTDYMKAIPTRVILHKQAALLGAAQVVERLEP